MNFQALRGVYSGHENDRTAGTPGDHVRNDLARAAHRRRYLGGRTQEASLASFCFREDYTTIAHATVSAEFGLSVRCDSHGGFLHQFLRVDFRLRMPVMVGGRSRELQHSHAGRETLPMVHLQRARLPGGFRADPGRAGCHHLPAGPARLEVPARARSGRVSADRSGGGCDLRLCLTLLDLMRRVAVPAV